MSNSLKFAKTLRTLSVATFGLAGVSIANSAQAAEIPMSPTLGVDSAYTIEQGSEFDYSFTYSNVDDQGVTTLDYYKVLEKDFDFYEEESGNITLDQTDFGSGSEIKYYGWSEDVNDNNIFAEKTSTTNDITVKYDSGLGNYIEQNQTSAGEISGGAIANDVANLGDINADFVNNYASGTSSSGGAIYNNTGEVGNITGDFVENYVYGSTAQGLGGAIYNEDGNFGDVTGDFVGNYANGSSSQGGAIYNNTGSIGNLNSNFVGNHSVGHNAHGDGGAIFNKAGVIGDINGDFVGNYVLGSSSQAGAIYNESQIGKITGNFIGNYVFGSTAHGEGGAIFNKAGVIGDIEGDFIGNYVEGTSAQGGAISNYAEIGNIKGNFIGNYLVARTAHGEGGAIFNNYAAKIGNIEGNFVRNNVKSNGGAILNMGEIGDIKGDFVENTVSGWGANGGAILNRGGLVGNIVGGFVGNSVSGDQSAGGAISNLAGTFGDITGNFVDNYASGWNAKGGAIYNATGIIGDVTGHFVDNFATQAGGAIANGDSIGDITGDFLYNSSNSTGGAIGNEGSLGNIKGDFVGNSSDTGGAIANDGTIKDINGHFISNEAYDAGAIGNDGTIGNITGDFVDNYASRDAGAIANIGTMGNINGDFVNNYAVNSGGAIINDGEIGNITGDFVGNASGDAGAIGNKDKIGDITGDFINNSAVAEAGAIGNTGEIGNITGDFVGNKAADGAAIVNSGTIKDIDGDFVGNTADSFGGAIVNLGVIGNVTGDFSDNDAQFGAAIINSKKMGDITGDFINNTAKAVSSVFNLGDIGNITGDFIGNTSPAVNFYNIGKVNSVIGDFIGNTSDFGAGGIVNDNYLGSIHSNFDSNIGGIMGGAVQNSGTISEVIGDFTNNEVKGNFDEFMAPLMYKMTKEELDNFDEDEWYQTNLGTVSPTNYEAMYELNSTYTSYKISKTMRPSFGGAITNSAMDLAILGVLGMNESNADVMDSVKDIDINNIRINNIKGNFVGNVAEGNVSYGGAIANVDWANKLSLLYQASKLGIVFSNDSDPEKTTEEIVREIATAQQNIVIDDIQGDFINNKATSGGAIANFKMDKDVMGSLAAVIDMVKVPLDGDPDFVQLLSLFPEMVAKELGIAPNEIRPANLEIGSISGDFVSNKAESTNFANFQEAINTIYVAAESYKHMFTNSDEDVSWDDIIGQINSEINREQWRENPDQDRISSLERDKYFIENIKNIDKLEASLKETLGKGGAIFNKGGKVGEITDSTFVNNSATTDFVGINAQGGAIYNDGVMGEISADFTGNYVKAENANAQGGAIYSAPTPVNNDTGLSAMMYTIKVENSDGSLYKQMYMVLNPEYNREESKTNPDYDVPLILLTEQLETLIEDGTITSFEQATNGSVLTTKDDWDASIESSGKTEQEYIESLGQSGMIFTDPNEMLVEYQESIPAPVQNLVLKNSNLVGNYAESVNGEAKGGAIYAKNTILDFVVDNGETTLISGNYTKNGEEIDNNAIYMDGGKLTFNVTNGSVIRIDDNINGENGYETYVIGDNSGVVTFNNDIKNTSINFENATINVTQGEYLSNNNSLSLNSGTLNIGHLGLQPVQLNDLSLVGGQLNLGVVDVDLANETMGRITADTYSTVSSDVAINVGAFNLTSDSTKDSTEILFADKEIKDNVQNAVNSLPMDSVQTAYTPIYKYNVTYDNREDGGFYLFNRISSGGNSSASFNPAVLAGPIAAQSGAVSVTTQTLQYAFQHSNEFMHIPYSERISMKNRNKYALSTNNVPNMGKFSSLYQPSDDGSSVWVKTYATFENIPFKNGPKVSNITYGTMVGFDSEMQHLKNGWDRVFTGYLGYHGASQRFSGVDSMQNGGLLGGTMTLYKGNFFNATTLSTGASVANNSTMYGNEDFAMLLSSVANKTGYNFEFKEGKLILQPSMTMAYTFVNTFDYNNAAGVRIDSKPLHALQLMPGVKVIGNLQGGWQPYLSASMVWNVMGESDVTANGVALPQMSIKPYVQYGVGLQKRVKDHFMAYGQAMIQNGGRNGISLTAGFRWALGHKECKFKEQKVEKPKKEKKVKVQSVQNETNVSSVSGKKILKQLTPEQKLSLGGTRQNTSRTVNSGMLKQL